MFAVDDPNDLAIAEDRHGQFAASNGVVDHVIRVLGGVADNLRHARAPHPSHNSLAKRNVDGLMNASIIDVFGAVRSFLDPHRTNLMLEVDDAIFQAQLLDARRRNVPHDVLRRVLPKNALREVFDDF